MKKMIDWRKPENRLEAFTRYYIWRRETHDLDHTHYCRILSEDYDFEQKAWFAFLFGQTYRTAQAYIYAEEFPDFHSIDWDELYKWNANNWKRCTYGTDNRYNKGKFYEQSVTIRDWLDGKTFKEKLFSICDSDDEQENFTRLFSEIITNLNRYGRMSTWLTCQGLYDTLDLPINPRTILVDDPSSWSQYNGVVFLFNKPEILHKKKKSGETPYTPSDEDRTWAVDKTLEVWEHLEEQTDYDVIDAYRLETALCQFKKLFTGHEYPGHATGDANERYLYYKENWPEIDMDKYRKALMMQPEPIRGRHFMRSFNSIFKETGHLINMDSMFDDMPNVYEELEIAEAPPIFELFEDSNEEIPDIVNGGLKRFMT